MKKSGFILKISKFILLATLIITMTTCLFIEKSVKLPKNINVNKPLDTNIYEVNENGNVHATLVRGTRVYELVKQKEKYLLPISKQEYQRATAIEITDNHILQQAGTQYNLANEIITEGERLLSEGTGSKNKIVLYLADQDLNINGHKFRCSVLTVQKQWGIWNTVARGADAVYLRQTEGYDNIYIALISQCKQVLIKGDIDQESMQAEKLGTFMLNYIEENIEDKYILKAKTVENSVYFRTRSVYWDGVEKIELQGKITEALYSSKCFYGKYLAEKVAYKNFFEKTINPWYGPDRWLYVQLLRE